MKKYSPPLLGEDEPAPFTVLNPDGAAPCLVICDHSGNYVPRKLDNLGLDEKALESHAAWDIGAGDVTRYLANILDAPAIVMNYSRLVIDVNRRPDHPTAFVAHMDSGPVPGNLALAPEDKALRIEELFKPYHEALEALLNNFGDRGITPAVFSIHSFTRFFYKQVRPWEIGVLWAHDERMPRRTIDFFRKKGFTVGDNEPYDARLLRGSTVNHHADARGLPNVLIEIRNDLLETDEGRREWAAMLGACFKEILQDRSLLSRYDGPQAPYDPVQAHRYFDELIEKAKRGD